MSKKYHRAIVIADAAKGGTYAAYGVDESGRKIRMVELARHTSAIDAMRIAEDSSNHVTCVLDDCGTHGGFAHADEEAAFLAWKRRKRREAIVEAVCAVIGIALFAVAVKLWFVAEGFTPCAN